MQVAQVTLPQQRCYRYQNQAIGISICHCIYSFIQSYIYNHDAFTEQVNIRLQANGLDIATLLVEDMDACRRIVQPLDVKELEESEQTSRDVVSD